MIKTKEGHKISLSEEMNSSVLFCGKSGAGKTYAIKSYILDKICEGNQWEIYDYSDSYIKDKFEQDFSEDLEKFTFVDISKDNPYYVCIDAVNEEKCVDIIVESLIEVLQIKQKDIKALLCEMCFACYDTFECIDMEKLFSVIKTSYKENPSICIKYGLNTIRKLYYILDEYRSINVIYMWMNKNKIIEVVNENNEEFKGKCFIYHMLGYSMKEKLFIVEMCLSIIWKTIVENEEDKAKYLVIDECQMISCTNNSVLAQMLRMGRKFGINLILGTQFYSSMCKELMNTIKQVGTTIFLKPADSELVKIAKEIDYNNYTKWVKKMELFKRGDMAVKGEYTVNENVTIWDKPILCRIER